MCPPAHLTDETAPGQVFQVSCMGGTDKCILLCTSQLENTNRGVLKFNHDDTKINITKLICPFPERRCHSKIESGVAGRAIAEVNIAFPGDTKTESEFISNRRNPCVFHHTVLSRTTAVFYYFYAENNHRQRLERHVSITNPKTCTSI